VTRPVGLAGGVLELRIHGVVNTPPEGTLGVRQVERVDGDEHTGFSRPLKESAPEPVVTEAYSWGSLTSASRSLNQDGTTVGVRKDLVRALWMLLPPLRSPTSPSGPASGRRVRAGRDNGATGRIPATPPSGTPRPGTSPRRPGTGRAVTSSRRSGYPSATGWAINSGPDGTVVRLTAGR
jgi:hypothetical protein